jgi:membrane-associated HD superfamily phosphohydrolase
LQHKQIDAEANRQLAFLTAGHTPAQAQQIRGMLEAQLRVKRKKADVEWNERKVAIEQEAMRRKGEIDNDYYGKKAQSESELRRAMRLNDNEFARKLEEIDQKYKQLIIDIKSA